MNKLKIKKINAVIKSNKENSGVSNSIIVELNFMQHH